MSESVEAMSRRSDQSHERHKAACAIREIDLNDKYYMRSLCHALGIEYYRRTLRQNFTDVCERLVYLLGGDEPGGIDVLHEMDEREAEGRITDELRDYLGESGQEYDNFKGETIASISGGLSPIYAIADRIDERARLKDMKADTCRFYANQMRDERDELRAKLDEADAAIANWREREKSFDASERLREELRRERDELRERLDRVADALRGVERGTMSAWEAADEVGRSSPHG